MAEETIEFNFNYRPESYWKHPLAGFTRLKGEIRQRIFREPRPGLPQIPDCLRVEDIGDDLKATLGRYIGPHVLGGENLPDFFDDEVEIARLRFAKTIFREVVSLRARPWKKGILYRCVNEYEESFSLLPRWTRYPLTFGSLTRMYAEYAGLEGYWDAQLQEEIEPRPLRQAFKSAEQITSEKAERIRKSLAGESEAEELTFEEADRRYLFAAQKQCGSLELTSVYYPALANWGKHFFEQWLRRLVSQRAKERVEKDHELRAQQQKKRLDSLAEHLRAALANPSEAPTEEEFEKLMEKYTKN